MIALWSSIAALCLAWFAGDALLGGVVAPTLFQAARESAGAGVVFAGLVFGELLAKWVVVAGFVCVIPALVLLSVVAGRSMKQRGWKAAALPLVAAFLVLAMHVVTATTIDGARQVAERLRSDPDPVRYAQFRRDDHARFRLIISLEMVTALGVAIGGVVAAWRCGRRYRADLVSAKRP